MTNFKFNLGDLVRIKGKQELRTVDQQREHAGGQPKYWLLLGNDAASGIWEDEGAMELVSRKKNPEEIRDSLTCPI